MGNSSSHVYAKNIFEGFIKDMNMILKIEDPEDINEFLDYYDYKYLAEEFDSFDSITKDKLRRLFYPEEKDNFNSLCKKLSNVYFRRFVASITKNKIEQKRNKEKIEQIHVKPTEDTKDLKEEELSSFLELYKIPENSAYTYRTRDTQLTEDLREFIQNDIRWGKIKLFAYYIKVIL